MRKYRLAFASLLGLFTLAIFFQNCSAGFESQNFNNVVSSLSVSGSEQPAPPEEPPTLPDPTPVIVPQPAPTALCEKTPTDSAMKKAAQSMKAGEWKKITTSTVLAKALPLVGENNPLIQTKKDAQPRVLLQTDLACPTDFWRSVYGPYHDNAGQCATRDHISYADSINWDPKSRCLYFFGSGHLVMPVHIRYCEDSNTWTYLNFPSTWDLIKPKDPYVYAGHAYDSHTIDTQNQISYVYSHDRLLGYEIPTARWHEYGQPTGMGYGPRPSAHFLPGQGVLTFGFKGGGKGQLSLFSYETQKWQAIYETPNQVGHSTVMEYNPRANKLIFGAGNSDEPFLFSIDHNLNVQRLADIPSTVGMIGAHPSGGNFVADANSENFLYRRYDGKVFEYEVLADRWVQRPDSPLNQGLVVATTVEDYGINVFVDTHSNIWLYKSRGKSCEE